MYCLAFELVRSAICRCVCEGGYEQPSGQSFVIHLTVNKLV
jgi:hypothetical protein